MKFIVESHPIDNDHYPDADLGTDAKRRIFGIGHLLLHMNKSTGVIAGQLEGCDHGCDLSHEELRVAIVKMVVNSLRMAELAKLTPEEIVRLIPEVIKASRGDTHP